MRTSTKLFGSLAVAGLVAAGGSAFTATGVVNNSTPGFVGGTVTQTVSGSAALSSIAYTTGTNGTGVTGANLTFADSMTGRTVTATLTGGSSDDVLSCTINATTSAVVNCVSSVVGGNVGTSGISINVA